MFLIKKKEKRFVTNLPTQNTETWKRKVEMLKMFLIKKKREKSYKTLCYYDLTITKERKNVN